MIWELKMIQKYFNKQDLITIREACSQVEQKTSGEIRVSILQKRKRKDKNLTVRELALREFSLLKMDKTRDHTGILIFILLKEKKFQILADKGINEKVSPETWQKQAKILTQYFKDKKYTKGITALIQNMGELLAYHFPIKPDDTNELPDDVVIH